MAQVYLCEDCGNSPGKVWAIFLDPEEAEKFKEKIEHSYGTSVAVVPRTVFLEQPLRTGYNA